MSQPESLRIEVGEVDGAVVLTLSGELDKHTSPMLKERITDHLNTGNMMLVVDLSDVEYLDSTGLGLLIGGLKRCREAAGDLRLICPSRRIFRIFEITGLTKIFDLHDSLPGALQGLADWRAKELERQTKAARQAAEAALRAEKARADAERRRNAPPAASSNSAFDLGNRSEAGERSGTSSRGMSIRDAARKGGEVTAQRHGPQFYSEIGRKGAQRSKERRYRAAGGDQGED